MLSVALRSSPSSSRSLSSLALSSSRPRTSHITRTHLPHKSELSRYDHPHSVRHNSTQPKSQSKLGATPTPAPSTSTSTSTSSALESPSIDDSSSPTSASAAEEEKNPIPLLDRPLGVAEPPTADEKSWKEKGSEFMDSEKQLEKRKALCVSSLC